MLIRTIAAVVLAGSLSLVAPPCAHAAESFDGCKGYITTLPATVSAPGTWCLKQNLATRASTGAAITITANDVTLDCNDFVLDDSAAGTATKASAVRAVNTSNLTIRHCSIRGFWYGTYVSGSNGGHLIEDNHFDGNTYTGIMAQGDGSVIRRNVILDTGGSSVSSGASAINATYSMDILDNTVSGVFATSGDTYGIRTGLNLSGSVSGNRVRNVVPSASARARGITNFSSGRMTLSDNTISGDGNAASIGLTCSTSGGRAKNNVIAGFAVALSGCGDAGGNDVSF